jgi:hypothetical protein
VHPAPLPRHPLEVTLHRRHDPRVRVARHQLQSLQDILKNPTQRGILGEYYLETLLKNVMPPDSYKMQYAFADGEIVEDVIYAPLITGGDAKVFTDEIVWSLLVSTTSFVEFSIVPFGVFKLRLKFAPFKNNILPKAESPFFIKYLVSIML